MTLSVGLLLLGLAQQASAIAIEFDYRYDTNGLFSDPQRRATLEAAGNAYARFTDHLTAITPGGANAWSVSITRPDGGGDTMIENLTVAEDSITVFVGGWSFHPSVLGWAGQGDIESIQGDTAWQNRIASRGQAGALLAEPTDYSPWGGAITFNTNVNWHFDPLSNPANGETDFLTTAMHELGHILGFGEADSWFAQIQGDDEIGYTFHGEQAASLWGGPVPLDGYGSHWAEGTYDYVDGILQETAMDPSTPTGQRQWLTDLDYAGFQDIGWQIPEPSVIALLTPGLMVGLLLKRRQSAHGI